MKDVERFVERLPDQFWKEVPQMARDEIVALMDSLDVHFEVSRDFSWMIGGFSLILHSQISYIL